MAIQQFDAFATGSGGIRSRPPLGLSSDLPNPAYTGQWMQECPIYNGKDEVAVLEDGAFDGPMAIRRLRYRILPVWTLESAELWIEVWKATEGITVSNELHETLAQPDSSASQLVDVRFGSIFPVPDTAAGGQKRTTKSKFSRGCTIKIGELLFKSDKKVFYLTVNGEYYG